MKALGSIVTIAVLGYLALCLLLFMRQRSMLYYPTPAVSPARVEAQQLQVQNDGQTLLVWHIPAPGKRALIYFGGNAEDVSLNIDSFRRLFPDWSIYLHNYRGYGGSTGRPTEKGLYADAAALYDRVRQDHDTIAVMGRSLGTGVAVYLASIRDIDRLVLVTPFDSMARLASSYYPLVPVSLLLLDRYDSRQLAPQLQTPTLVLIAEQDEVIPAAVSAGLVEALNPENTKVAVIEGAGHNNIGGIPHYEQQLASFLRP